MAELFLTCFGRSVSVEHLRWKLASRPGALTGSWLAESDDGRVVGHLGAIPVRLWLGGSEHPGLVLVDGMVHPDFRRRGVISDVRNHARRSWIEGGASLGLVLPNEQWGSRVRAFGWQPVFPFRWRRLLLRPSATLARRFRLAALGRLRVLDAAARWWSRRGSPADTSVDLRPLTEAGPELDELWLEARAGVGVSLVRDRAWVAWRYLEAPAADFRVLLGERDGRAVGYVAYRLIEEAGSSWATLADVFADPREPGLVEALLAGVVRHLAELGVESVAGLAVPGTDLDRDLHRSGFRPSRGSFGVHLVPYREDLPLEILRNPRRWLIAGGDFDIV
ncbi:MAG: GNAT family N-acetyltransferase [Acidimicrobiales bacterium]|nr:GNAT family N-acetyltransferase [Acidimicrobiales bacterium]